MSPMSQEELEKEGFKIVDAVEMDLSAVREERVLLPAASNVKMRIRKATGMANPDNTYRQINVSFQVVDGLPVGEEVKFKGSVLFERVCYYADPSVYTKDFFKRKQHLVLLQQLIKATGGDVANVKVDDEFLISLSDKVLMGDIRQAPNKFTAKDGTEVSTTINKISRLKPLPMEEGV